MGINFGSDKIKEIYVGSDKIKEVYHGSDLVWKSGFDGILFDNGYEGVEWEQGYTNGTSGTEWTLDKSQNALYARVFGNASGGECAWTTKDSIDISGYTNLKVVLDSAISALPNRIRLGVALSIVKNKSLFPAVLDSDFKHYYLFESNSSNGTDMTVNMPLTFQGLCYISVNAVKRDKGSYSGSINVKELVLT